MKSYGSQNPEFNQEAFAQRLVEVLGREPLNRFAKRAEMSDNGLKKYLYEGTIPPIDRALRLANAAGCSFSWLMFGIGKRDETHPGVAEMPFTYAASNDEFTRIASYEVAASAGHGSDVVHEAQTEPMAFRTDWLKREGLEPSKLAVIRAKGDSMEPTIADGDVLLVRLTNGDTPRDGLHVLRMNDGLFVKRLQFDLGGVRVISDNPLYQSRDLTREQAAEMDVIGRVVWAGKKF